MKIIIYQALFLLLALSFSCGSYEPPPAAKSTVITIRPSAKADGKFFEKDGRKYLYGGEREDQHFDITNCSLQEDQFHYGLGRELFPALLEPEFITVASANAQWSDEDRFLLARIGNETKAYSIKDLTRHEVVNDVIDGRPVFAAYCILADLGAMYDRVIGGREYTFALSGYTYYDPNVWNGMDGFVLWDRETESLWWLLTGKAVSGIMKDTKMAVMDEQLWKQTTWQDIWLNHPDAQVLQSGQDFERPSRRPRRYTDVPNAVENGKSIAPKWGGNKKIQE